MKFFVLAKNFGERLQGADRLILVCRPERSESAAWRGAEQSEHRRVPEVAESLL